MIRETLLAPLLLGAACGADAQTLTSVVMRKKVGASYPLMTWLPFQITQSAFKEPEQV